MVVYHLQKASGKSGWKVNGTRLSGSLPRKIPGSNGTSEKVVLFPDKMFQTENSCPIFSKSSLTPVSRLAAVFRKMKLICTNGKRDSGTKLTSPEFCLQFTQTVNRAVARVNGKQSVFLKIPH